MRISKGSLLNFILWSALIFALCGTQTTLWFYLLGQSATPQLWLIVVVYLVLYRKFSLIFFYVYFVGFIVAAFSAVPLGTLLPTLGLLTATLAYIKSRFFWPNTRYFVFACFFSALLFHSLFIFVSYVVETNTVQLSLSSRAMEVLLTTLFAMPLYWLLKGMDRWTWSDANLVSHTTGAGE